MNKIFYLIVICTDNTILLNVLHSISDLFVGKGNKRKRLILFLQSGSKNYDHVEHWEEILIYNFSKIGNCFSNFDFGLSYHQFLSKAFNLESNRCDVFRTFPPVFNIDQIKDKTDSIIIKNSTTNGINLENAYAFKIPRWCCDKLVINENDIACCYNHQETKHWSSDFRKACLFCGQMFNSAWLNQHQNEGCKYSNRHFYPVRNELFNIDRKEAVYKNVVVIGYDRISDKRAKHLSKMIPLTCPQTFVSLFLIENLDQVWSYLEKFPFPKFVLYFFVNSIPNWVNNQMTKFNDKIMYFNLQILSKDVTVDQWSLFAHASNNKPAFPHFFVCYQNQNLYYKTVDYWKEYYRCVISDKDRWMRNSQSGLFLSTLLDNLFTFDNHFI